MSSTRTRALKRCGAGAVVLLSTLSAAPGASASVAITALELLPGDVSSVAVDVNEHGVVVGTATDSGGRTRAMRWDRFGRVTDLGAPGTPISVYAVNEHDEVLGGTTAEAVRWDAAGRVVRLPSPTASGWVQPFALNDRGQAVATHYDPPNTRGVRWDRAGRLTVLEPLPGDTYTDARVLGRDGTVAGLSGGAGVPGVHAVRWDDDGSLVALPPLSGHDQVSVSLVDDRGSVLGSSIPAEGPWHAVSWDRHGRITDLGQFPRATGWFADVNRHGVAVGRSSGAEPFSAVAVRLDREGRISTLPRLPGTTSSEAVDVNDTGLVVGNASTPDPGSPRPVWWDRTGGVHELPGLPGALYTSVIRVNDRSTAVGTAWTSGGSSRAVRWVIR